VNAYWSYLLTAVGIYGLLLLRAKKSIGWVVGLAAQTLWLAYAIATRQWGFILSAACYGTVNTLGLIAWRKAEREQETTT
jgi:hypothetical protein